jgi:hypothetical protein
MTDIRVSEYLRAFAATQIECPGIREESYYGIFNDR